MKKIIVVMITTAICLGTSEVKALILNDGTVHTVDWTIDEPVSVEDSPGGYFTTLNLLDGGEITNWINVLDYSLITLSGGSIGYDLFAYDFSHTTIYSGSIGYDLYAFDYSQVELTGGSIGNFLSAREYSQVTIFGSDFAVDGIPVGYGPITEGTINELGMLTGTLTGTLQYGDLIDNFFYIDPDATIILVPEPASLLLLGAGSLCFRRRNRK